MNRPRSLQPKPDSGLPGPWLVPDPSVVRTRLLRWARGNLRSFPWRNTKDPYSVMIAEVLLRKTAARAVPPVYEEFLRRVPTPQALARSSVNDLQSIIAPLGLSAQRAAQLSVLGRALVDCGGVPRHTARLASLPGIGPYATAAVQCFAFEQSVPMVDTNVARVITRVFAIKPSRFEARRCPEVWRAAAELVRPSRAPRRLNWAILDLAATLCKPRSPLCGVCPLADRCRFSLEHSVISN